MVMMADWLVTRDRGKEDEEEKEKGDRDPRDKNASVRVADPGIQESPDGATHRLSYLQSARRWDQRAVTPL